jgi:hypothetical protein
MSQFKTLGQYGLRTLDQARKKARRFLVEVLEGPTLWMTAHQQTRR